MGLRKSNFKKYRHEKPEADTVTKTEREAVDEIIGKKFGKFAPGKESVEILEKQGNSIVDVKESVVTDSKGDSVVTDTRTVVDKDGGHMRQATVAEASDPMLFLRLLNKLNSEPVSEEKMRSFEERVERIRQKCARPKHKAKQG
jgi:hypothetical protein